MAQRLKSTPSTAEEFRRNWQILSGILDEVDSETGDLIISVLWGNISGSMEDQIDLMNRFGETDDAIALVQGNLDDHEADITNPHSVTKTQVGLGNVDNEQQATKTEFDSHVGTEPAHGGDLAGAERPPEEHGNEKHAEAYLVEDDMADQDIYFYGGESDTDMWAMTLNLGDSDIPGYDRIYSGGNA